MNPLIVCEESGIGTDEYEEILFDSLFSLVDELLEPSDDPEMIQVADENTFLFMQDNASCHKVTCILEFLSENRISVMEWPPQLPDLNPLENLWTELKVRFHIHFTELFHHPSKSLEAKYRYGEILQEVWYSQGMKLVKTLIKLMLKCYQLVIDAKGRWTKY